VVCMLSCVQRGGVGEGVRGRVQCEGFICASVCEKVCNLVLFLVKEADMRVSFGDLLFLLPNA
jgi:hypothetical protein